MPNFNALYHPIHAINQKSNNREIITDIDYTNLQNIILIGCGGVGRSSQVFLHGMGNARPVHGLSHGQSWTGTPSPGLPNAHSGRAVDKN